MVSWCYRVDPYPPFRLRLWGVCRVEGGVGGFWGTGSLRLRWSRGGRARPHAGSSPSRMGLRCPGGGKVNLLLVPSLHFGEGERAAHREGGRRLAGRAGLRKQESRGGATGERGRSCQWEAAVSEEGAATRWNRKWRDLKWNESEWAARPRKYVNEDVLYLDIILHFIRIFCFSQESFCFYNKIKWSTYEICLNKLETKYD